MPRPSSAEYSIRATFRAPLPFVFAWCTDYSASDPAIEKDDYRRRLLSRTPREVRYEDLTEGDEGWMWSRWTVALRPPDAWQGRAIGNYRNWVVDYRLRPLPDGRTELHLRGRRRPAVLGESNPPRKRLEAELSATWKRFAKALEADYRRSERR